MNFGEFAGEVCKKIFPIPEEKFVGNNSSKIAICTLSSIDLLNDISQSDVMKKITIVGRLLSENKGIDEMVRFVNQHPELDTIIVCGKEVTGHKTGHALFCLHRFGTDENNRIINSVSPDPVLMASKKEIKQFQNQVKLIDKIGETYLPSIIPLVQ